MYQSDPRGGTSIHDVIIAVVVCIALAYIFTQFCSCEREVSVRYLDLERSNTMLRATQPK
jgi:hypothetical protein